MWFGYKTVYDVEAKGENDVYFSANAAGPNLKDVNPNNYALHLQESTNYPRKQLIAISITTLRACIDA